MPGRLFLVTPVADIAAAIGRKCKLQHPPRTNIAPGQDVLVLTTLGFENMRWGMIMSGRKNARGRPAMETIVNARSETVFDKTAFEGVKRAVVPANGWYEWTGKTGRKTAWRIRPNVGGILWFSAVYDVWSAPGGLEVPQVSTITCAPNGDVRDIHHRMGALLSPEQIEPWLSGADVPLEPFPDGALIVERADDVDWNGA